MYWSINYGWLWPQWNKYWSTRWHYSYGKRSKILNTSCLPKRPRQTGQSQIRLLLKKQSDQGLPSLVFWQVFKWIPALNTNLLFENRSRKVFEIFEHLLYPEMKCDTLMEKMEPHYSYCPSLHKVRWTNNSVYTISISQYHEAENYNGKNWQFYDI